MSSKVIVMTSFTIGSLAGSYIPVLLGASVFGIASIIFSAIGGILGIYIGYRIAF